MNWRRSPSAVAVLTIPLLLCLPQTLVAAFSVHDYVPSSLRSGWLRGGVGGGGSLVRRNSGVESGYYNPLDYGGYMLTVSFYSLLLPFHSRIWVPCRWDCHVLITCCCHFGCSRFCFRAVLWRNDSTFLQSGRLGSENL